MLQIRLYVALASFSEVPVHVAITYKLLSALVADIPFSEFNCRFGTYTHLALPILLLLPLQLELSEWIRASWLVDSLGLVRVVLAVSLVVEQVLCLCRFLAVHALLGVVILGSTTYQMF